MVEKIVFFDIDGTLVDHQKKIPKETIDAVKALKNNGVYVAMATGRAPFMIEGIRETLEIDSFVSFNGQYVVFEGETVYANPLPTAQLTSLYDRAKQGGHSMIFMNHNGMKASVSDDPYITNSLASLKFKYPEVDPEFFRKESIYQALLFCEDGYEKTYEDNLERYRFIRWHDYSCDVLPGGGSKAVGVDKLIEASGLSIANSYGFGDGLNDLEMIQYVGTGVAMGNSVPELKEVADLVTDDVNKGGLANGLARLGLLS